MPDSDRVSIWSIAGGWGTVFYILFSIQVAVIVVLVGWREIAQRTDDTPVDTILAIGVGSAPNIFTAAAINIAVIFQAEVIAMLAERYLRRRFEEGKKEGIERGIERGIEQGIEQGLKEGKIVARAEERARNRRYIARLRAWDGRRIEAAEKGEPFDEPMPEPDDDDKTS